LLTEDRITAQLVQPYSKLAVIYDDIMAHVDYKKWSRYVMKIIRRWHPGAVRILDISCGTGSLLLKLDSRKYCLYGFDFSFDMVKIAREKCRRKNDVALWQGNMVAFGLRQRVDVIISLYDSVNYILEPAGWQRMFNCVYDGLNQGGLFIFDICTETNSKKYFRNYFEKNAGPGYSYERRCNYQETTKIHSNEFLIFFESENKSFRELHQQKIFLIREVLSLIQPTKFQLLGAFHGFTFKPATEDSLRVHFVLKK